MPTDIQKLIKCNDEKEEDRDIDENEWNLDRIRALGEYGLGIDE